MKSCLILLCRVFKLNLLWYHITLNTVMHKMLLKYVVSHSCRSRRNSKAQQTPCHKARKKISLTRLSIYSELKFSLRTSKSKAQQTRLWSTLQFTSQKCSRWLPRTLRKTKPHRLSSSFPWSQSSPRQPMVSSWRRSASQTPKTKRNSRSTYFNASRSAQNDWWTSSTIPNGAQWTWSGGFNSQRESSWKWILIDINLRSKAV